MSLILEDVKKILAEIPRFSVWEYKFLTYAKENFERVEKFKWASWMNHKEVPETKNEWKLITTYDKCVNTIISMKDSNVVMDVIVHDGDISCGRPTEKICSFAIILGEDVPEFISNIISNRFETWLKDKAFAIIEEERRTRERRIMEELRAKVLRQVN